MTTANLMTAEEALFVPEEDARWDLIRGELGWTPFMWFSESMAKSNLLFALADHAHRHGRDGVLDSAGFILERNPDTVLGPDAGYTPAERLPPRGHEGFIEGHPDLAVELICHADPAGYVTDKVVTYLAAGTKLLWLPEPRRELVLEYRREGRFRVLRAGDVLDAGDALTGFRLPVAEVFR